MSSGAPASFDMLMLARNLLESASQHGPNQGISDDYRSTHASAMANDSDHRDGDGDVAGIAPKISDSGLPTHKPSLGASESHTSDHPNTAREFAHFTSGGAGLLTTIMSKLEALPSIWTIKSTFAPDPVPGLSSPQLPSKEGVSGRNDTTQSSVGRAAPVGAQGSRDTVSNLLEQHASSTEDRATSKEYSFQAGSASMPSSLQLCAGGRCGRKRDRAPANGNKLTFSEPNLDSSLVGRLAFLIRPFGNRLRGDLNGSWL